MTPLLRCGRLPGRLHGTETRVLDIGPTDGILQRRPVVGERSPNTALVCRVRRRGGSYARIRRRSRGRAWHWCTLH